MARTREKITLDIKRGLETIPGLDIDNPTGVVNNMARGVASSIHSASVALSNRVDSLSVSTASGTNLDSLAITYGVRRKEALPAGGPNSVLIYSPDGVFGDHTNGQELTIPMGFTISSRDRSHVLQIRRHSRSGFMSEPGIVIRPDQSRVLLPAYSISSSRRESIPPNTIVVPSAPVNGIRFTNPTSLSSIPRETDENLRFRIEARLRSDLKFEDNRSRSISILSSILSIDGISNVIIRPAAYGPGTNEILVVGSYGAPPMEVISEANAAAVQLDPTGIYRFIPVSTRPIRLALITDEGTSEEAINLALNYIDSLEPGEPFILEDYISRLSVRPVGHKIWVDGIEVSLNVVDQEPNTIWVLDSSSNSPVTIIGTSQ